MLREWLGRFAEIHRRYGPVIKAWTEAEIDNSEFGRMGANVLGDFVIKLGQRIAKSPAVVADPQLAALALVAMIERSNYYAISGQMGNGKADVTDTLAEIAFAALVRRPLNETPCHELPFCRSSVLSVGWVELIRDPIERNSAARASRRADTGSGFDAAPVGRRSRVGTLVTSGDMLCRLVTRSHRRLVTSDTPPGNWPVGSRGERRRGAAASSKAPLLSFGTCQSPRSNTVRSVEPLCLYEGRRRRRLRILPCGARASVDGDQALES